MPSPCLKVKYYRVNNLIISFYNLLAVIYDKKILNPYKDKCVKSQMYHIVKDVASLITLSSEKHNLTAKGRHF